MQGGSPVNLSVQLVTAVEPFTVLYTVETDDWSLYTQHSTLHYTTLHYTTLHYSVLHNQDYMYFGPNIEWACPFTLYTDSALYRLLWKVTVNFSVHSVPYAVSNVHCAAR